MPVAILEFFQSSENVALAMEQGLPEIQKHFDFWQERQDLLYKKIVKNNTKELNWGIVYSQDEIDDAMNRGKCGRGCGDLHELAQAVSKLKIEQRRLDEQLSWIEKERAKKLPSRCQVSVIKSFDIKDHLKAKGYKFDREGYWSDALGMSVTAAWQKTLLLDQIAQESEWLASMGCELKQSNALKRLLTQGMA